jgi:hypothetical protein
MRILSILIIFLALLIDMPVSLKVLFKAICPIISKFKSFNYLFLPSGITKTLLSSKLTILPIDFTSFKLLSALSNK